MKKLLLIVLLYPLITFGQINLVPNPSFEYGTCPDINSYNNFQNGNIEDVDFWVNGNNKSADYFNVCASIETYHIPENVWGSQYPLSGAAYCGIYPYNISYNPTTNDSTGTREYIYVELEDSLTQDSVYLVGFFFSAADEVSRITPNIGIHFFNNEPDTNLSVLPYEPDYFVYDLNCIDSVNISDWILVEKKYKAKGDEKFLAIGCFQSDEIITANLIENENSFYTGQTYLFIDDVFVYKSESEEPQDSTNVSIDEIQLDTKVYPNPTQGILHINIEESGSMQLFNLIGQEIESHPLNKGANKLNLKTREKGMYMYQIIANGIPVKKDKLLLK